MRVIDTAALHLAFQRETGNNRPYEGQNVSVSTHNYIEKDYLDWLEEIATSVLDLDCEVQKIIQETKKEIERIEKNEQISQIT